MEACIILKRGGNDVGVSSYAFVELKSFGDLVVAASSIRTLSPADVASCRLLIGPHLSDLTKVLAPPCMIETLAISDRNVPALFDVKKCGIVAGLRSAAALRSALATAAPGTTLVLPRSACRERFIVGQRVWQALPRADNVYVAFERFMRNTFLDARSVSPRSAERPHRIALCPFSRVAAKNVPVRLIAEMSDVCARGGFQPELLLLEGERLDEPLDGLAIRIIPRRFDMLANALAEYSGVISADSLPAHLAEYRGTPAFVASPVSNTYWLPSRAFESQHWGVFEQARELIPRLKHFLDTVQQ